eukprot:TRINITY_DN69550_c0_g1_i1.p2 TRINITY_DN69550_c0_g1~~TRINITY_DN69550_c0_g1_i1.p2  ORF type:complete len:124 (-),score=13.13 TRINITY_DN69550_c0_g1_i1:143-514(-)
MLGRPGLSNPSLRSCSMETSRGRTDKWLQSDWLETSELTEGGHEEGLEWMLHSAKALASRLKPDVSDVSASPPKLVSASDVKSAASNAGCLLQNTFGSMGLSLWLLRLLIRLHKPILKQANSS